MFGKLRLSLLSFLDFRVPVWIGRILIMNALVFFSDFIIQK